MSIKPLDRLLFEQGGVCFFCSVRLPREEATVEHLVAQANGGSNAAHNCVACCREINTLLGCLSLKEKLRIVLAQKGKFVCPKRAASAAAASPATIAKSTPAAPAATPAQAAAVVQLDSTPGPDKPSDLQRLHVDASRPNHAATNRSGCPPKPDNPQQKAPRNDSPAYCTLVLTDLKKRGHSKPKRVESLKNTIRAIIKASKGSLTDSQLNSLLQHLQASGKVRINGTAVSYSL